MGETLESKEESMVKEGKKEMEKSFPTLPHVHQVKDVSLAMVVPIVDFVGAGCSIVIMVSSTKEKEGQSKSSFLSNLMDAIQEAQDCTTSTFQNLRLSFL